ncbi:MAG: 16S rRNA (cytosine(967)-C(5))-methyltransferase RsmB [Pseudomonadota bacterium]
MTAKGLVRADAAGIVAKVLSGRSLSDLKREFTVAEPGLTWAMAYGTVRDYWRLAVVLKGYLDKPLRQKKDDQLQALLLVGLHQLYSMRVPEHAAVSETVAATGLIGRKYAKGLVNAVLRRAIREKQDFGQPNHPTWMVERIKQDWPEDWSDVLSHNDEHPPLWLRVNTQKSSRDAYLDELTREGISYAICPWVSSAVKLNDPVSIDDIPGFFQGRVSVQDAAAQLAAFLLDVKPGMDVLDACAAPGGKTCHVAEQYPDIGKLQAVDIDPHRLTRIQENIERLNLKGIETIAADVASDSSTASFDRILLDAPCSASGVIRRHPDIKLLRNPQDVTATVMAQQRLLKELWRRLRPEGLLLYVTCSIFREENEQQIQSFIKDTPDVVEKKLIDQDCPWGRRVSMGRQILPGEADLDGFYYACLRKERPKQ